MKTKVYGYSDDIVCINDSDEIDCFNSDTVIVFSDSTVIRIGYSKAGIGVWWIDIEHLGEAESKLTYCTDEEAEIYSDIFETNADVIYAVKTASQKYPNGKPLVYNP